MIEDPQPQAAGSAKGQAFVGRSAEVAALATALEDARSGRPRVALITGLPGIGKTTLVNRFLARDVAARIARVQGDPDEALVPYGIIDQLLRVAGVEAVDVLEGGGGSPSPGPVEVGLRVLATLSALQRDGVAVLVVDDAQWVDGPSLQALSFALRRLAADHVLAIVTARTTELHRLPDGLRRLVEGENGLVIELGPLAAGDLRELASHFGHALEGAAAARLAEHTAGNPLYARALLAELPPSTWRSASHLLPAPRSYADIVRSRLADVSERARNLAEAASVLGQRLPLHAAAELVSEAEPLPPLRELVAADVLSPVASGDGGTVVAFAHPLTRAGVYHALPPDRRAALHAAAARRSDDDHVQLHHRVLAAHKPDATLASQLEAAADDQAAHGAWFRAATTLAAASRLSPQPQQRDARLLKATDLMALAGDVAAADALIEELADTAKGSLRDSVLAHLLLFRSRPHDAEPLLERAWRECDQTRDAALAARISRTRMHYSLVSVRGRETLHWAARVLELAEPGDPARAFAIGARAISRGYLGEARRAERELERVLSSGIEGSGLPDLVGLGWVKLAQDDFVGAVRDLTVAADAAWKAGSYETACLSYALLARAEFAVGRWDDAHLHADRSLAISGTLEYLSSRPFAWWAAALVPAARGEEAATDGLLAALDTQPAVYADQILGAAMARAVIATWRGEPDAALAALAPIIEMEPREGVDEPGFWPWQPLYGEALLGTGRLDEARGFIGRYLGGADERGLGSIATALRRLLGRLEAGGGDWAVAAREFEAAIADAGGMPFERALTELAYGEALRRQGQRRAAAAKLQPARDTFVALGARPAAERADRELLACGLTRANAGPAGDPGLTPQEHAVRRLVAKGMTNRQIAAELLVSPKTVEVHLTRIYSKLGVSSRTQLMAMPESSTPQREPGIL